MGACAEVILWNDLISDALVCGSGSANIKPIAITEPGIYTIEAESCDGYAPINVNVLPAVSTMPLTAEAGQTYHASDYGVDGFDPVTAVGGTDDKGALYDVITGNTEEIPLPSGDTVDGVMVGADVWDSINPTCGNDTTVVDTVNNFKIRIYADVQPNTTYPQLKTRGNVYIEYTDLSDPTKGPVRVNPTPQNLGAAWSLQGWKIDDITSENNKITVMCSRYGMTTSGAYERHMTASFNGTFDPNHMAMTDYTVTAW